MGRGLIQQGKITTARVSAVPYSAGAPDRGNGHHSKERGLARPAPVAGRPPSEQALAALYSISEATQTAEDLDELYRQIHDAVGALMPAINFYIALYDDATDILFFPYQVDEVDQNAPPSRPGRSLTSYVLRNGQPLLASQEVFDQLVASGEVELIGAPSYDWMGVPLRARKKIIGVMVVQTYTPEVRYSQADLEALAFVSTQVGMAIERKRDQEALRAGEERYRLLFENAPVGILVATPAGGVIEINPAALQLLGSPSAEATRTINIYKLAGLERIGFCANLTRCVQTGRPIKDEGPYCSFWGKNLYVYYYMQPIVGADARVTKVQIQIEDITQRKEAEAQAARLFEENALLLKDLEARNAELVAAYEATIEGWSRALEMRDKETKGHSDRVTRLSLRLALRLGISGAALDDLRRGVLLHDIGKMVTPDAILLKPGPLNDDEWKIMRQHPTYAYQMLRDISFLAGAIDIPYAHHENYDGTGYPRGLLGEQIPLGARIFALVDVWDALTSSRPYRPAWTAQAAIDFIVSQSGKRFDPRLTVEFLALLKEDGIGMSD